MRMLKDRYKIWSKILQKHERKWEENHEANLDALYSNQCQIDRMYRAGMLNDDEYNDLTNRYLALKEKIENI